MKDEQTFEQKQAQLESIVARLEGGDVPLDEMIALYEQGEALYRDCTAMLASYETRMQDAKKERS